MLMKKWMVAAALLATAAVPAGAATVVTGIGPRVGFAVGPDQLLLGGHVVVGEVAPSITFDPSLELGFGDNLTVIGFNFDLHYHFEIRETDWRPYLGAGVTLNFVNADLPGPDDSSTGVGGGFVIGAGVPTRSGNRFFGELKIGLGDEVHDLKLVAGWNFKM